MTNGDATAAVIDELVVPVFPTDAEIAAYKPPAPLKLDFGCGPHPREGFEGVDQYAFDGKVKHVWDVRVVPWPWADNSVAEAHASHFIEHLTATERVAFCNELYRVLVPGGACQIIVPHWCSHRAYGDPTHQWPPVSEMWPHYLNKEWRMTQAPHTDVSHWSAGYSCNFAPQWGIGYNYRQDIMARSLEAQQYAITNFKEVCQDLILVITKIA